MNTSGFYNKEFMLRAGKFVYGPNFTLKIEEKDTYNYPIEGWYWFNNVEEAASFFEVKIEEINLDLPNYE